MEGDQVWQGKRFDTTDFYPRPHMEGDADSAEQILIRGLFLPTPSHGGRPHLCGRHPQDLYFYPRPHMEGDRPGLPQSSSLRYFYPRPHMEGDFFNPKTRYPLPDFYPRPHMEGDLWNGDCPQEFD